MQHLALECLRASGDARGGLRRHSGHILAMSSTRSRALRFVHPFTGRFPNSVRSMVGSSVSAGVSVALGHALSGQRAPLARLRACIRARERSAVMIARRRQLLDSKSAVSSSTPCDPAAAGMRVRARDACAYCARRENLRRTTRIALVVGLVLTLINQSGVIAGGDATTLTWVRCALNFVVPFCVANAGLLSGRR